MSKTTDRRDFMKLCGRTAAAVAVAQAAGGAIVAPAFALENAPRARLVKKDGSPLKAGELPLYANWIFHYPYNSSPALLIKLDDPAPPTEVEDKDGKAYQWPGGAGPDKNIVAYAAICAHALSYDSAETAFLNYRRKRNQMTGHGRVITCCAHASVYDPAAGAKVLAGPAKFPLAAVLLEHKADTDELFAVGLMGSELYGEFFKAYRKELRKAFGRRKYKKMVTGDVVAMPIAEYSRDAIEC
ncbi:MAG TPA: (2Fe-2S)-binding protein [Thermopetrobacter sp.]|nr:(2Fe-2S)-binding protein [Thermopetrobacter sp.]